MTDEATPSRDASSDGEPWVDAVPDRDPSDVATPALADPADDGEQTAPRRTRRTGLVIAGVIALLAVGSIWGANEVLVARPVAAAIDGDPRNSGFELEAHYRRYIDFDTLVLDLTSVDSAAPLDLFRGLFQSAEALAERGRRFDDIILSRSGATVFTMSGADFFDLGEEFASGQNPVYLIRTLPESLLNPDGTMAFSTWTGGWLGVLNEQMEDANDAAARWAAGG